MQTMEPALAGIEVGGDAPLPQSRPGRRRLPVTLTLAAGAVAAVVLLPAAYLVVRGSEAGVGGMVDIATSSSALGLLSRSTLLAACVTASALAIGVPLAWLTTRTDLPGRRAWLVLTSLPLAIPSFIGGFAFVSALGPRGLVQGWLEPLGVDRLPSIYGFPGAWLVLTLFTYPYVLLAVRAAVQGLDPAMEEASRALGHGTRATLWRVVLPQLRPAMTSGGLLVALYALSDFGAVSLLRFDSFTRAIFFQYRASFDRTPAAVLSLMLLVLTVAVISGEIRMRGRAAYHRGHGGTPRPAPVTALGWWRWPAVVACGVLVAVALVLPMGVVGYWLVRGLTAGETLTLTWQAARHSLEASFLGALASVVAAWPVAALSVRHGGVVSRLFERVSYVGYALPGIVVALSLVFFGARFAPSLYQTRTMLVSAYVVLFLPIAVGAIRASLLQVSPSLEEASRALGHGPVVTWWRVVLPLVRPGLLAGFALSFLTAMKELPATLLLAPTGYATLATEVWGAAGAVFFARAAAPALALVLLSSLPLALLTLRER
jgi:iron(III) transport system permease protein